MSTLPYTVSTTSPGKSVANPDEHFINVAKAVKFAVAQTKLGQHINGIKKNGVLDQMAMQLMHQQLASASSKNARPEVRALEHLSELTAVLAKIVKTEDLTREQRQELSDAYLNVARSLPFLEDEEQHTVNEVASKVPTGALHSTVVGAKQG